MLDERDILKSLNLDRELTKFEKEGEPTPHSQGNKNIQNGGESPFWGGFFLCVL